MTMSELLLHAGGVGAIFYGYNSLKGLEIHQEIATQYGGSWQYLTIQGIHIAELTLLIGLVLDIFPSARGLKSFKRMLLTLSLPMNIVISSIYWPLILFFPGALLQNAGSDSASNTIADSLMYLPLEMDLAMHAVPVIALTLDFFLFEQKYGRKSTRFLAPFMALIYAIWYGCWIEHCSARNNGIFPYPFLSDSSFIVRLGIYAGVTFAAPLSFWILNSLHA